ncbi:hydroxysqualene dehydroxylase HpnE [Methyloversatilis thermotolerans]|uniref:hydroxysqualene dehydroxylase HpnE n=1 Tax=Methyloversatilis thermotolerans TaxID=1346290 RepID=UPI00037F1206|nr:hydroxysqualene dehydroxylase HpnE [Methyloversatilis thermotolerans]
MKPTVGIIGGGWAGLACAVECVRRGLAPVVFEAAAHPGGRARGVSLDGLVLDNGQHILIGAYTATLDMMHTVGADPDRCLHRLPLTLSFDDGFALRARGGSSLARALALLTARGLHWRDVSCLLRLLWAIGRPDIEDETVSALLARTGQRDNLVRHLWDPLCVAALNTAPDQASARVFARVLADSLLAGGGAADLLLPRVDLGALFPEPAVAWLTARGVDVMRGSRVRHIRSSGTGFDLDVGETGHRVDNLVIATAPQHAAGLMLGLAGCSHTASAIDALEYEAITTVYAAFDASCTLPDPMTGFVDGLPHWVFDRGALGGPPGLLAAVVSADTRQRNTTEREVLQAMKRRWPELGEPLWVRSLSERRASFRCVPHRPLIEQPADRRIAVAGDYMVPDYPATLESAVRSGIAAAHRIAHQESNA